LGTLLAMTKAPARRGRGRPPKVTPRIRRIIRRLALNDPKSTTRSISGCLKRQGFHISKTTVASVLKQDPTVKYGRSNKRNQLSKRHKTMRIAWAQEHKARRRLRWEDVIFVDEKKWSLDGPDGSSSHWHLKSSGPRHRYKRHTGGGKIMVFGGFSSRGVTKLYKFESNMKSLNYIKALETTLLPSARKLGGPFYRLVQDGARPHWSKLTSAFFKSSGIRTYPHPPCSPDLNPIENLWGIVSNKVYAGGKQYKAADELWAAVQKEWSKIPLSTLKNLAKSMPDRINSVLAHKGAAI
jgi:hypothetical protein